MWVANAWLSKMARGTILSTLRAYLKAELRDAQETNTTLDAEYNYALANKQRDLLLSYDWEFLKHDWDLACGAGSRYLDIPVTDTRGASVTINFERPIQVHRLYNSYYEPVAYGIGAEQYNLYEGVGESQDPIQAWRFATNTSEASDADEIEIWPVPVSAQTLRFSGQRNPVALTVDASKAELDDMLLVYFVAADYLAQRDQTNAPMVFKKAMDHLVRLRSGYPVKSCPPTIIGRQPYQDRENIKLIAVT